MDKLGPSPELQQEPGAATPPAEEVRAGSGAGGWGGGRHSRPSPPSRSSGGLTRRRASPVRDYLGRRWSQALESLGTWWVRTRAATSWHPWESGTADHHRPAAHCDGGWREPPAARPAATAMGLPGRTAHPARTPGAAPGGRGKRGVPGGEGDVTRGPL